MLAYHIMGSVNPAHAVKLVYWLWRSQDTFLVSFDNPEALARFNSAAPQRDNVKSRLVYPVVWSGHSIARTMVSGISALLKEPGWLAYTLLSDTDVPLKPAEEIAETIFSEYIRHDRIALHHHSRITGTWPLPVLNEDQPPQFRQMLTHVRKDVRFFVHWQLETDYENMHESPIYLVDKRARFHVTEDELAKTLTIRPLLRTEIPFRDAVLRRIPLNCGRNWHTLTRAACEWFCSFGALPALDMMYTHTAHSNESLFQTVMLHEDSPWRQRADRENRIRWLGGEADQIDDVLLPKLKEATPAFARKIKSAGAEQVLAWLESIHRK